MDATAPADPMPDRAMPAVAAAVPQPADGVELLLDGIEHQSHRARND